MKFFFVVAVLSCFAASRASAQSAATPNERCATVTSPQAVEAVRAWTAEAPSAKTTSIADTVALTVHLVGNDAGAGTYALPSLWKLICKTNERFAPTGIYFQLQWPIRYIPNSAYYNHDFSTGYGMVQTESVPGTVNAFFVSGAAGACGYFFGGTDAVVVANMCAGLNSTTLVHELGHVFGLPHTFYGWENGAMPSNPERVTRTGPQANCSFAADGFCDTDADFISYRWPCPAAAVQYDDLGVRYHPDSSIYMSYSTDVCQSRFSAQQMGYMQFNLANARPDLLTYVPEPYQALDTPAVSYPVDTMWTNDRTVRWAAVPGADYYYVTIRRTLSGIRVLDTLVAGTSLFTTHPVAAYNQYTVNIAPLSSSNVCAAKVRARTYVYSPVANPLLSVGGDASAPTSGVQLFPNPASGEGWTMVVPSARRGSLRIILLAPDGRVVRAMRVVHEGGALAQSISARGLADGLYFLRVEGDGVQWTGRAMKH